MAKSAPSPSGVRYTLLKWAHQACPDAITLIFNLCLDTGTYPWHHTTIVVLNKPNKPNYSNPKAYRPISLLECVGKVLKKIVAKWFNHDISTFGLLPMTQFGSCPHHTTVDAAAVLTHCIQATCDSRHARALILFDISGFFDNVNPECTVRILALKGFPDNICRWTLSFLTEWTASLRMGTYMLAKFGIMYRTPQGSPLSPILSTLYTSPLLNLTASWTHCDLTMYVDDGTIYATSATANAAAKSAVLGLEQALAWLHRNGLTVDPDKTELITFTQQPHNPNLIGRNTLGVRYTDPIWGAQRVTKSPQVWYLGVFLNWKLTWRHHVNIMASRARSTIRGINILGNSIRGLDLLNWWKVYNALVIPVLMYGATVWFTGVGQKGLVQCLQVAQNEGIHKITGMFKTTPLEPLHNMIGVPPIAYLLTKLMHTYSLRLQSMPPDALICTVLTHDRCCYWPNFFSPNTNLTHVSIDVGSSTYRPTNLCTARLWDHPYLMHSPNPTPGMLDSYKAALIHPALSDTHVLVTYRLFVQAHFGLYFIRHAGKTLLQGCAKGIDQMQAISLAVKVALPIAFQLHQGHLFLWLQKTPALRLLTLTPHRDTHISYDTQSLIAAYLTASITNTLTIQHYCRTWPGALKKDLHEFPLLTAALHDALATASTLPPRPTDTTPKAAMWACICTDYTPSTHPSHVTCVPPDSNALAPVVQATADSGNQTVCSTLLRLALEHCFDATYSLRFRKGANDNVTCPCSMAKPPTLLPSWAQHHLYLHTKQHVILHCALTQPLRILLLQGIHTWDGLFASYPAAAQLCTFLSASHSTLLQPLPATPSEGLA